MDTQSKSIIVSQCEHYQNIMLDITNLYKFFNILKIIPHFKYKNNSIKIYTSARIKHIAVNTNSNGNMNQKQGYSALRAHYKQKN